MLSHSGQFLTVGRSLAGEELVSSFIIVVFVLLISELLDVLLCQHKTVADLGKQIEANQATSLRKHLQNRSHKNLIIRLKFHQTLNFGQELDVIALISL